MWRAKTPEFRTAPAAAATQRCERCDRLELRFIPGKQLVKAVIVHGAVIGGLWLIVYG
jgi:hypothetical protein